MSIRDDDLDEVRHRADILQVIGDVVELKKAGKEWKGRCPFHEEKSPSFYVDPAKGLYHCFGCGAGGDAIKFAQERLGLDFEEAVKHVGARSGIQVRESTRGQPQEDDPRRPFWEALALAQTWFQAQLQDPEVGREARDYLSSRGMGADVVEEFGIGFAPDSFQPGVPSLREAMATHQMSEDLLIQVGLLKTSEKMSEPYDAYRGRIIFPITSESGKVIGFGGRVLSAADKKAPKYINSPESPVYHKSETLFRLDKSRNGMRREGEALVVEGYMDVVSLAAAGFPNAVAPLGTAMTEAQARLIRKYTERALLLYDSDRAGQAATFKSGDILLAAGVHPYVVTLPEGEDPDTLVQSQGAEALKGHMSGAVDLLDRKLQILEERGLLEDIAGKTLARDKVMSTLAAASDPILLDQYVAAAAAKLGARPETLHEEVHRYREELRTQRARVDHRPQGRVRQLESRRGRGPSWTHATARARSGPEYSLLRILARDRNRREELLEWCAERIGPEDFKDPVNRAIFEAFLGDHELEVSPPDMGPQEVERLERLLAEPPDEGQLAHGEREFQAAVAALEGSRLSREIEGLQARIAAAVDEEEKLRLIEEKRRLLNERSAQGRPGGGDAIRRLSGGSNYTD